MSSPKRILCRSLPKPHHPSALEESEANHATRVLRLRDGDIVEAMDGNGHSARAVLRTRSGPLRLEFVPEKDSESTTQPGASQLVPVILEVAVLKGEAMEWVVEKAVELGATSLVPVLSAHTVVQMDRKGPEAFRERWQKIADQALKQCGRLARLEIRAPQPLEALAAASLAPNAARIWCDEQERAEAPSLLSWLEETRSKKLDPLHLLIGPEGGWSTLERELLSMDLSPNFANVSLGPIVLRAETAAIYALSLAAADFRVRGGSPATPIATPH